MEVICLEEKAFYALLEQVIEHVSKKYDATKEKWISDEEAMHILRISSRSTLQKFRDEGRIRFTQPEKKIILYDRDSIAKYLEKNARDTF